MELIFIALLLHSLFWVYMISKKINILNDKITKDLISSFIILLIACSVLGAVIYFFAPEDEIIKNNQK